MHTGVLNGEQGAELLQAQEHVYNQMLNFINSFSLKCAIQLGIPDIIHKHNKPMTISGLLEALPINKAKANCIPRLMRILVHSGFFINSKVSENGQEEGYLLTPACRILLRSEPLNVTPFLLTVLNPVLTEPWHQLGEWFQNDLSTPFEMAHGSSFWDYASQDPKLNASFNEGMASDARLVNNVLISDCPQVFEGINSLVDVGGGIGTVAKAIATAFQHLKCIVLDLPHVVNGLQESNNVTYIGGDMFDYIPRADAVLLKCILHDWSDEESIKLLKKCKEAIPSKSNGGKVIIIDMVVGYQKEDHKSIQTQLCFDMFMMVLVTGKERNENDWAKLFFDAGFSGYKIINVLGLRCLIEVYP